jgi:hypothetical protein
VRKRRSWWAFLATEIFLVYPLSLFRIQNSEIIWHFHVAHANVIPYPISSLNSSSIHLNKLGEFGPVNLD